MNMDPTPAQRFFKAAQSVMSDLVRELITVCEIPAPTFHEERRTEYVERRFRELGLGEVQVDAVGNVIGRIHGQGRGPTALVAAHIDTVFPMDTPVTVKVDGDVLRAPSICDNSSCVAVMLLAARLVRELNLTFQGDVILAATVGEEGLGNLRGIRAIMDSLGPEVDYVIALDGALGGVVRQGVGSRRFRLVVHAEGGHSWGAFGSPSAIHALGRMIAQISEIRVPSNPKTTFNVGTITGGTSVNTIAANAEAVIDLRSLDTGELKRLEDRVRRIVAEVAKQTGVAASLTLLGDRPTGSIPEDHPLCEAVKAVHQQLGIQTRMHASSTDGNVPLSMGIPAVTVGVTLGGNGHRTDEYIHTPPLAKGLAQVLLLLQAVGQLPRRAR